MSRWSLALAVLSITLASAQAEPVLRETARIPLPHVAGRLDHMSVDLASGRLYVAALGNRTVEVVDVRSGQLLSTVEGFEEPQGILAIPESDRVLVTDGGSDHAVLLDAQSLTRSATVTVPEDSDNVRFDPQSAQTWIGAGNGRDSALLALDPNAAQVLRKIGLRAHPESFQLETAGPLIYVNVPAAGVVEVADRDKGTVVSDWVVPSAGNFPMALDEASKRLFVATRHPAQLLVFDTTSGKVVATTRTVRDADDVFFDRATQRVYVSGGEGFVHVYQWLAADRVSLSEKVHTRAGARTSLFVPEWHLLFVALPSQGNAPAEIRVFEVATP